MAHFLFNVSGGEREAARLVEARMWGIGADAPHADALSPGDLVLIYAGSSARSFVARAEVATPVHRWTPAERDAYPGDPARGVVLRNVERWDRSVPLDLVVSRIDPTASNPQVQANARGGFPSAVVRITEGEYETAVTTCRAHQRV
jgi:EVE domain